MSDSHGEAGSEVSLPSTAATNEQLYDYNQCIAALEGRSVPVDLTSATARCAVIRGLRCSYDFAVSRDIVDLCASLRFPKFVRARNARLIMSNVVPDGLELPETQPYCIWNPDFATEQTYRQLAQRYPSMRYQVGRACAAAGYFTLYTELDLLPDVSIAEEAREGNTEGGDQIYQSIMSSPLKYAVMDDYARSINADSPPHPAFLNAETHVRWKLEWRFTPAEDATEDFGPEEIDIEEDRYMGLEVNEPDESRYDELSPQEATLLWQPLPLDLPTMKKDLLRQMAAFEGSVDRYDRLINRRSREEIDSREIICVVRGIYHHTMFARWWQHQIDTGAFKDRMTKNEQDEIQTAINARRVMINEIGTFTDDTPCKPWLIWYPLKPESVALCRLATRCPSMHGQIAIAAIYCDYKGLYEWLRIRPSIGLMEAAEKVGNPFYKQDLERRAAELDITDLWQEGPWMEPFDEKHGTVGPDLEPTGRGIWTRLRSELMDPLCGGYYRNNFAYGGYFERYVWLSFETIRKMEVAGYIGGEDIQPTENDTHSVNPRRLNME
ncbi:hypothetical protein P170DRAFT_454714 [Aspergillus steynii IBT 23096]|uniref:Uncharacterized protein n=1 Tax=Aspergillus steynii IBT 23096 TaxID=1392250 RepID=A0A2I2GB38_9EURO|nr:uncharacterized protein P170DRAFT_454714 [Aspergillus steynii IBT 23096]PLB50086.1 hypothetical protein P170DRAFT_454714 [Aspergillus steynii IBT 23096]